MSNQYSNLSLSINNQDNMIIQDLFIGEILVINTMLNDIRVKLIDCLSSVPFLSNDYPFIRSNAIKKHVALIYTDDPFP